MKRYHLLCLTTILLLLISFSFAVNAKIEKVTNNKLFPEPQSKKYIVTLIENASVKNFENKLKATLGTKISSIHEDTNTIVVDRTENKKYISKSQLEQKLLSILGSSTVIEKIEEDRLYYAALADSVPMVNATYAWDLGYNGSGVNVCVIDTGIDYFSTQLPAFQSRDFTVDDWCIDGPNRGTGWIHKYKWNVTSSMDWIELGLWWVNPTNLYTFEVYHPNGSLVLNITGPVTNSTNGYFVTGNLTPLDVGVYDVVVYWTSINNSFDYPTFLWGSNTTNQSNYYSFGACASDPNPVTEGDSRAFYNIHPHDDHSISHGTHVSGTIAKQTESKGVAPGVNLYVAKALASSGFGHESDIMDAIQWCLDNNVDIISMSLGATNSASCSDSLAQKVADNTNKSLFVIAAGNSGPSSNTVSSPGCVKNALTVGAVNKSGSLASFSSRGPGTGADGDRLKPEITAPGVGIVSTVVPDTTGTLSGTSMATPHVSGVAALLKQKYPSASPQLLKALIIGSGDLTDCDNSNGCGLVNVERAFNLNYTQNASNSTYLFNGTNAYFAFLISEPENQHTNVNFSLFVNNVAKDSSIPKIVGKLNSSSNGTFKILVSSPETVDYILVYPNSYVQVNETNETNNSSSSLSINVTAQGGEEWIRVNRKLVQFNITFSQGNVSCALNGSPSTFSYSKPKKIISSLNSFSLKFKSQAKYNLTLFCSYANDSSVNASATKQINYDRTRPTITSPSFTVTNQSSYAFNYSVTDNLADSLQCVLSVAGNSFNNAASSGDNVSNTLNFTTKTTYSYNIRCTDPAGNLRIRTGRIKYQ